MASTSVFLNVRNIEKSVEFYKALGFTIAHEGRAKDGTLWWVDLNLDGAGLGLGNIAASDDAGFKEWVSTPLGAGVVVYFDVAEVDTYHQRAVDVGAEIEVAPEDRRYGRVFTLNDPDGYTVTFLAESSG